MSLAKREAALGSSESDVGQTLCATVISKKWSDF